MAKLFKLSAYLVDYNGDFDAENLEDYIMWRLDDVSVDHVRLDCTNIEVWHDDHPLNNYNCPEAEYEKYFKEN